jgi:hypothetical protein
MAEEKSTPTSGEPRVEGQQAAENREQQTPKVDPIEEEARTQGWVSREEFEANPANAGKKWRSAELFLELTPLYEKLDSLHRTNKTLNQGLKALAEHNKKIEIGAYNRAKAELLRERKNALEEQDFVKAEQIRDQIDALPRPTAPAVPDLPPEEPPAPLVEWKAKNRWYSNDPDAKMWADAMGASMIAEGKTPVQMLEELSKRAPKVFPHLFTNPKRESAPSVESGGTKGKSSGGFQLTSEETAIMNRLIASGAPITRDEYIAQLKRTRGE